MQVIWSYVTTNPLKVLGLALGVILTVATAFDLLTPAQVAVITALASALGVSVVGIKVETAKSQAVVASKKAETANAVANTAHDRLDQIAPSVLPIRNPADWSQS